MENIDLLSLNIEKFLPRLKTSSDYWLVRAESGEYYEDFNRGGFIAVGWNSINEQVLEEVGENVNELKSRVENLYKNDKLPGRTANQIKSFIDELRIGDLVLVPSEGSEYYMLGEITSDLYHEKSLDLLDGLGRCPFVKRKKVRWIKSFNKKDADSKILKLSYRQQTVNEINEYKTIINRALYDAYIDDDELLHLTYGINIEENINMVMLSQFLFQYTQIYEIIANNHNIDIKINAQSKGKTEIITKTVKGIVIAGMLCSAASLPYGGKITFGGGVLPEFSFETPGIINEKHRIEKEKNEMEINQKKAESEQTKNDLENLEKAYELSKEMQIPIEELNIEIPDEFKKALDKAIKEEQKENTSEGDRSVQKSKNSNVNE